jgi:hypothetical protein
MKRVRLQRSAMSAGSASRESQLAQLSVLWSFLGLPPLSSPEVDYYLNPDTAKLGGTDTYGRLPNAAQSMPCWARTTPAGCFPSLREIGASVANQDLPVNDPRLCRST